MNLLFCNITSMKYYRGITPDDPPNYGGSYVIDTGDAYEQYNFLPFVVNNDQKCLGFVETKSTIKRKRNQLHIERISDIAENAPSIDDVLIVFCSKYDDNCYRVVGWYKHATAYRNYKTTTDTDLFGNRIRHEYNFEAKVSDCVLLPYANRNSHIWSVKRKRGNVSFGFGQANVWFAEETTPGAIEFKDKLINQIENYTGPNDMNG